MKPLLIDSRRRVRMERKSWLFDAKPYHVIVEPDYFKESTTTNPLEVLFRDQATLITEGIIVWGAILQANTLLFETGDSDHPAGILFSLDPYFDDHPEALQEIAHYLYSQKGLQTPDPEIADFAELITDEHTFRFNLKLPVSRTRGREVYFTTTLIARKHLPNGILSQSFFPYLVLPDVTDASMVLPSAYWHSDFVEAWNRETMDELMDAYQRVSGDGADESGVRLNQLVFQCDEETLAENLDPADFQRLLINVQVMLQDVFVGPEKDIEMSLTVTLNPQKGPGIRISTNTDFGNAEKRRLKDGFSALPWMNSKNVPITFEIRYSIKKRPEKRDGKEFREIIEGDRLSHGARPDWGVGEVKKADYQGIITVAFSEAGEKKLWASVAPLTFDDGLEAVDADLKRAGKIDRRRRTDRVVAGIIVSAKMALLFLFAAWLFLQFYPDPILFHGKGLAGKVETRILEWVGETGLLLLYAIIPIGLIGAIPGCLKGMKKVGRYPRIWIP